jgi:hypothetical protein
MPNLGATALIIYVFSHAIYLSCNAKLSKNSLPNQGDLDCYMFLLWAPPSFNLI